jgi:hypothetical protein
MRLVQARRRLAAAIFFGCVASSCGSTGAQPGHVRALLKQGEWGGLHIAMTVAASKTDIEFDCGKATITGAIETDADGAFTASGTFLPERPGPTTPDPPPSRPMRMTGTATGDDMQVTIALTDQNEEIGTFSLRLGTAARLTKCR